MTSRRSFLRNIVEKHRFFVRETPSYMAGIAYSTLDYIRAYLRFMWFSLR